MRKRLEDLDLMAIKGRRERRSETLVIRLTPSEKHSLRNMADKFGLSDRPPRASRQDRAGVGPPQRPEVDPGHLRARGPSRAGRGGCARSAGRAVWTAGRCREPLGEVRERDSRGGNAWHRLARGPA